MSPRPARIFVSYSHLDVAWFARLRPLLTFRPPARIAHVWHDQKLEAGTPWHKEICDELEKMNIFLCLVSHSFYASNYIMSVELKRAKERYEAGEIEVVPILLEDFNLKRDIPFLHGLNQLPKFERAWNHYNPRSGAFCLLRDGVFQAIDRSRSKGRIGHR